MALVELVVMRPVRRSGSVRLLLAILAIALMSASAGTARADFAADTARGVYKKLNAYRMKNDLPKLQPDRTLSKVSHRYAVLLARLGKLDHRADGRDPGQRMKAAGYRWCTYAENIAWSSSRRTPEAMATQFMKQWTNSRGHRANMLKRDINDVGIGVAADGRGRIYAVQVFGRSGCR